MSGSTRNKQNRGLAAICATSALLCLAISYAPSRDGLGVLRTDVLLQAAALEAMRQTPRLQQLDLVTKMNGYSPNGISYSEGQMPLGLGAASGICDHGYCPQESEEIQINPREGVSVESHAYT